MFRVLHSRAGLALPLGTPTATGLLLLLLLLADLDLGGEGSDEALAALSDGPTPLHAYCYWVPVAASGTPARLELRWATHDGILNVK